MWRPLSVRPHQGSSSELRHLHMKHKVTVSMTDQLPAPPGRPLAWYDPDPAAPKVQSTWARCILRLSEPTRE